MKTTTGIITLLLSFCIFITMQPTTAQNTAPGIFEGHLDIGKVILPGSAVYDVENLYFSEVVTPLRGIPYYGLSGNRYGLMNLEFRFPLVRILALGFPLPLVLGNVMGVAFTDVGASWFDGRFKGVVTDANGSQHLNDIHTGFGCGMRLNMLGFALLRYDIAWTTDFSRVSDRPSHYFSLGADF